MSFLLHFIPMLTQVKEYDRKITKHSVASSSYRVQTGKSMKCVRCCCMICSTSSNSFHLYERKRERGKAFNVEVQFYGIVTFKYTSQTLLDVYFLPTQLFLHTKHFNQKSKGELFYDFNAWIVINCLQMKLLSILCLRKCARIKLYSAS